MEKIETLRERFRDRAEAHRKMAERYGYKGNGKPETAEAAKHNEMKRGEHEQAAKDCDAVVEMMIALEQLPAHVRVGNMANKNFSRVPREHLIGTIGAMWPSSGGLRIENDG